MNEAGDGRHAAPPRIGFYGDDFTGATDTLATVSQAGLRALLFLRIPDAAMLERAGPLDALGIAGAARSMDNAAMVAELLPVGEFFRRLGPRVVHYKTCSTFDSSPAIGSIGTAIATLRPHSPNRLVAIVGGQPNLNRYCVFGNLFATVQTGGAVYRIDRHETMSLHPVTPMAEADLRLHLARQGLTTVSSLDYTAYDLDAAALDRKIDGLLADSPAAVLFDVGHASHLPVVGRTLWERSARAPLLAIGASSVAQALIAHWRAAAGQALPAPGPDAASTAGATVRRARGPVLVIAGSLSGVTARQRAMAASYAQVAVPAQRLVAGGLAAVAAAIGEVVTKLAEGRHVLVHTGGDGKPARRADAQLAKATGQLLRHLLAQVPLKRVGIAGGDTSSHAVKALDCWGLGYLGAIAPGVALCRVHADSPQLDGMELMLKGGQMGPADVFERLLGAD